MLSFFFYDVRCFWSCRTLPNSHLSRPYQSLFGSTGPSAILNTSITGSVQIVYVPNRSSILLKPVRSKSAMSEYWMYPLLMSTVMLLRLQVWRKLKRFLFSLLLLLFSSLSLARYCPAFSSSKRGLI